MTTPGEFSAAELQLIESIVEKYKVEHIETARRLADNLFRLFTTNRLSSVVHSMRAREKDPEHLRDKLQRRLRENKKDGTAFDVTPDNVFEKINDLAGIRLLHLHTEQFEEINRVVLQLLAEEDYEVLEGPEARVWDDEYRAKYENKGIATKKSERLYTSIHYVVETGSRSKRTAEIQVRTLADELWGEVDHSINYPHPCEVVSCREQIKVLARVTSSCTRLVDSIFVSMAEEAKKAPTD